MAGDDDDNDNNNDNGKTKKRKYLPHSKPLRKGLYPLRPRVQGFFTTCDGGRERQATNEALSLLETTICMVGVAERYKELSKYNLRQLTAPQQQPRQIPEEPINEYEFLRV